MWESGSSKGFPNAYRLRERGTSKEALGKNWTLDRVIKAGKISISGEIKKQN